MKKETWIGTSWKMNKTIGEARAYAVKLRKFYEIEKPGLRVFIIPPFTALQTVCNVLKESSIKVGAQNMHWVEKGSFTGEISPLMLKDCGVEIVELGHSERRAEFGETDLRVNRKVLTALRHGMRPLICVGETVFEKEFDVTGECIARQIKIALRNVSAGAMEKIMIAYEPIWAVGENGTPAKPEYANAVQQLIRTVVQKLYGKAAAKRLPILYGGSVDRKNASDFIRQPNIDGLFVGRAAWNVQSFIELIQRVEETV